MTIESGWLGRGPWIHVRTMVAGLPHVRHQDAARIVLGSALFIEAVVNHTPGADSREMSELQLKVATNAQAISGYATLDDQPVAAWRVQADVSSIGVVAESGRPLVVFAESVEVPEGGLIVSGHASVWPFPLRPVTNIERYLAPLGR